MLHVLQNVTHTSSSSSHLLPLLMPALDYHFDSTGKKLKSKWDSYDVDAELDKVDDDTATSALRRPTSSPDQLRRKVGELEHEFEAVRS
ncbi:hypothetical protein B5M09_011023 [Aphanomyces astaci]|uniref:Uncharacterized protein n=1 Tax=Aphanomyces astaci TaxID=112090 RepID=A0A3R7Y2Z9_APHAT|nr:hypothetical protein B5M09_011023 [Aphanomyces astaci]